MQMEMTFPGGSRIDAVFKGFRVETDQPTHKGGGGTAPSPFDTFLASIGTCAGLYVLKFLEQRKLSTKGLSVVLSTTKDRDSGMISEILLSVVLPEDFPPKYERAIVGAVGQCSVKKHLQHPPVFRTEVTIGRNDLTAKPASV